MIKYDRDKHVELITVAAEALANPAILRQAADMAEQLGLVMESGYDGLRFFRDKTEEEVTVAAEAKREQEENRVAYAAKQDARDRELAAEFGLSYEQFLARKREIRGY